MRQPEDSPRIAYINTLFAAEPPGFAEVRAAGEARRPGMQVSAREGALLRLLVAMQQPRHILEIGTFMGYSTLWMAQALPVGGRITTLEKQPEYAALAREHYARCAPQAAMSVEEGDALALLAARLPSWPTVEMVFIDAEKRHYKRYLDALEPFLPSGALVVGDNTFLFDQVYRPAPESKNERASREAWEAMRAFNARLADRAHYDAMMLDTQEGLTIARKK